MENDHQEPVHAENPLFPRSTSKVSSLSPVPLGRYHSNELSKPQPRCRGGTHAPPIPTTLLDADEGDSAVLCDSVKLI